MSKYYDTKQLPKEPIHIIIGTLGTGKTYHEMKKLKKMKDKGLKVKVIRKFGDSNE